MTGFTFSSEFQSATSLTSIEGYLRGLGAPKAPPAPTGTARDVASFNRALTEWGEAIQKQVAPDWVRRATAEALVALVQATPVDTGRARNGWGVNGASGQAALPALAAIKLGDSPRLTNPIPYMERLRQGHSKQAPAGWIEAALLRVRLKIEALARAVRR